MLQIALIGPGLIGRQVLVDIEKIENNIEKIENNIENLNTIKFRVIGICNSKKFIINENGVKLTEFESNNDEKINVIDDFIEKLKEIRIIKKCRIVIIDCTASNYIPSRYEELLRCNFDIVTPNKKAFSSSLLLYKNILKEEKINRCLCLYESTVGAGLPIISTIKDILLTGDTIYKIEGVFSGTLSYIFNKFCEKSPSSKLKFSEIVLEANKLGYTEPDPRDDLNGIDVARKVVILGRLIGIDISLENIYIENIVPDFLRNVSKDEFINRISEMDKIMENEKLINKTLRYIARIDNIKKICCVKLDKCTEEHPFYNLSGSDNIIAIYTKRFKNPLIIRGAGAGPEVTSFGILSDLLKLI